MFIPRKYKIRGTEAADPATRKERGKNEKDIELFDIIVSVRCEEKKWKIIKGLLSSVTEIYFYPLCFTFFRFPIIMEKRRNEYEPVFS